MNYVFALSLVEGLKNTIVLSLLSFLFGGPIGAIVALARISPASAVRKLAAAYIQLMQGIPLLVLMGLCYFGPILFGFNGVTELFAATLAMSLYTSAFVAEIWRGCLQAVPKAQWEAAECIGLSRLQRMWYVIVPQALKLSLPPTVGMMVQVIKNTSIASIVIGFPDLSYNAKLINNTTFQPFIYFGLAGVLYFCVCYPLSELSRTLERKLNVGNR
ncbi:amino acid ABC transporter permease [Pseudorhodoplanes sp.]|uniref:amino acid ABC transporter permease n=1 Tax=Pseudorhodoplanes sp. TaxID=1934341 RepID=UPI002C56DFD7|nr:amino acid ABC transporter permease [Pseudorhodoplanes sp.]HWV55803.1 amino acid ABC transporter permease [Pseudorhodoplanes sp.]